ncbi:MAG: DNA cytosine methyltransferase [Bacteroidales bacterium]|nr:DNA cytosine methyltransferase [Bacteroidales bacterium]
MKLVDIFAGCGGMSLGFQNAGFDIVAAYDNWQPAIDIYRKNFSHPIHKRNLAVEDITEELKLLAPDIIIGGPPCQDFSIAGKLNLTGCRANLTRIYSQIIAGVRPQWFVMENVHTIERSPIFAEALKTFTDAGYGITKHVWDASYMGVPQMRRRYFVIGRLGKEDDFMLQLLLDGLSDERMTIREYFGGKFDVDCIYQHPRNYKRRGIFSIDEPCSTIRSVNRPIPANYAIHPADKTSDLSKVRPLTTKERSYMQTFPKSFEFVGNNGAIEQAIGNAVPVKMAEYIANAIMQFENSPQK